nr:MAG TPA: hypothetical protein [Caudoviricetes sp.]
MEENGRDTPGSKKLEINSDTGDRWVDSTTEIFASRT